MVPIYTVELMEHTVVMSVLWTRGAGSGCLCCGLVEHTVVMFVLWTRGAYSGYVCAVDSWRIQWLCLCCGLVAHVVAVPVATA